MKLRDFLELYNGAGTICINDDNRLYELRSSRIRLL